MRSPWESQPPKGAAWGGGIPRLGVVRPRLERRSTEQHQTMKQMEAFFRLFFFLKKTRKTPSLLVSIFLDLQVSPDFLLLRVKQRTNPSNLERNGLRQASSMDLFRKQEAAERQLMEWKQVPERWKFFFGGALEV